MCFIVFIIEFIIEFIHLISFLIMNIVSFNLLNVNLKN